MSNMTPREIVHELDKHIIGQQDAKRAVAIALRNRWRRMQLPEALRAEISPKNILMIGPTGVGKTEIARRLAKLANAPFVKACRRPLPACCSGRRAALRLVRCLGCAAALQPGNRAAGMALPPASHCRLAPLLVSQPAACCCRPTCD